MQTYTIIANGLTVATGRTRDGALRAIEATVQARNSRVSGPGQTRRYDPYVLVDGGNNFRTYAALQPGCKIHFELVEEKQR